MWNEHVLWCFDTQNIAGSIVATYSLLNCHLELWLCPFSHPIVVRINFLQQWIVLDQMLNWNVAIPRSLGWAKCPKWVDSSYLLCPPYEYSWVDGLYLSHWVIQRQHLPPPSNLHVLTLLSILLHLVDFFGNTLKLEKNENFIKDMTNVYNSWRMYFQNIRPRNIFQDQFWGCVEF